MSQLAQISIVEVAHFYIVVNMYEVKIQGNEMTGTGRHIKGKFKGMQFETSLKRVGADGLTDLELLSGVTSEEQIGSSYSALVQQGLQLLFLSDEDDFLNEAKKIFLQAVNVNPKRPEAFVGLGVCCFQLEDDKATISHFEEAINNGFESGSLYEPIRFKHLSEEGNPDDLDEYELGFEVMVMYRAMSHYNLDDFDLAEQDIESVYDNIPEEYEVEKNLLRAQIFFERNDLENAELYLGKALVTDPDDIEANILRRQILLEKGGEEGEI